MLSAESFPHWKPCLFLLFSSFIPTSLQLTPPWHSIIKLARTSRFPVPRVWYPITRRQFVLCEDNINISILKYWDVKFHTGPLMHSGNHSLLLRLPATQLSEDHVTGEGKSDSLTFSLSLSLFWPWLPSLIQCRCGPSLFLSPSLRCASEGFRCTELHGRAIDEEASLLWQLTFTRRLSLACPHCWLHRKQTDN